MLAFALWVSLLFMVITTWAQPSTAERTLMADAKATEARVIEWRRHFHEFPELSNREFKTAEYIAAALREMGLEVQTGIAHTGVVGILKTGKPGPVVGLRADIDALPVTERANLPFASKVKVMYNGQETGVMHACGHDSHAAILLGAASILARNKSALRGIVKFIFQPAEEGGPVGEERGAQLMVKEGVLKSPDVQMILGLHINSQLPVGFILYKSGPVSAANDDFYVTVRGKQSHGAYPWVSVDPIVISSEIIVGLQTVISRQSELTKQGAVLSVGRFHAGIRENIIPEEATFSGTIRTLDTAMRSHIHKALVRTATKLAESGGATAEVRIIPQEPMMFNDPGLTRRMVPALLMSVGTPDHLLDEKAGMGAEDFSFFQEKVPGLYISVGAMPHDKALAGSHHTPEFYIDESGFVTGLKAMLLMTYRCLGENSR